MSTNLTEAGEKLRNAIRILEQGFEQRCVVAVNNLASLMINRVTQEGKGGNDQSFTPYSTAKVPAFFFFNKSRTEAAERKIRDLAKKGEKMSYMDFRRINGLKTDKKIFEFTGELFRTYGVVEVRRNGPRVVVKMDGKTELSRNKIMWNSEREGRQIDGPSREEIQVVKRELENWVESVLKGVL